MNCDTGKLKAAVSNLSSKTEVLALHTHLIKETYKFSFSLTIICTNYFFRRFSRYGNVRWATIVYRLIGAALI